MMKKLLFFVSISLLAGFASLFLADSTQAASTDPSVDQLISLILSTGGTVTTSGSATTTTTTVATTPVTTSTSESIAVSADDEFLAALSWMYTNGLTQFSTPKEYAPMSGLTRQQAAKFFVVFAQTVVGKTSSTNTTCTFTDTGFDSTLKPYVLQACEYGIMWGKNNIFRPNDKISKAEFTAALVRIILGKKLDESTTPRWLAYYVQARDWTLTKEQNANAYDGDLTRHAAALLLYRSVGIVKNLPSQTTSSGTVSTTGASVSGATSTTSTGTISTSGIAITTGSSTTSGLIVDVPLVTSLTSDPALQEAVYWLHDIGVTKYTDINDYRPFDTVSRQEAAKMFVTFRYAIGSKTVGTTTSGECQFTDLANADQSLVPYIEQACNIGILKGSSGLFLPFNELTRAQAVAILLRITDGYQDESGAIWWQKYYDRAIQLGMISPTSADNFQKPISRYEIAMLLYKSKVQKDILSNLNNNFETNKFIFTVSPTTVTTTGNFTGLVSINTYLLESNPNGTYIVDLFGSQYKIAKTVTQKYLNNDYVWYGKMLLLDESKEIGTVSLTISNGVVIAGTLRAYQLTNTTYTISPSSQQPYYTLVRKVQ